MVTEAVRSARYMTRFSCLGGSCEDTCCGGWKVPVDEPTHRRLRVLAAYEPAAERLLREGIELTPGDADFARLRFRDDGYCAMLEPEGLCAIHAQLGPDALPDVCMTYPRYFNEVDGALELFGSVSCPEVARLCLLDEQAFEAAELSLAARPRKLRNQFRTDEPYFRSYPALRQSFVQLLEEGALSLSEKLFVLLWFSHQLSGVLYAGCSSLPSSELEKMLALLRKPELLSNLSASYHALGTSGAFALSVLRQALSTNTTTPNIAAPHAAATDVAAPHAAATSAPPFGAGDAALQADWQEYRRLRERVPAALHARVDACLTRYAINHVFTTPYMLSKNVFGFAFDLVVRVAALRVQLLSELGELSSTGPELDAHIVRVVYRFGRRVEHAGLFERLARELEAQGLGSLAHAVAFVGI